jgi:hypothetical protein
MMIKNANRMQQESSFPEVPAPPAPKLHQQLYGIKAVEIDHARDIAFAWYGGPEVLAKAEVPGVPKKGQKQ